MVQNLFYFFCRLPDKGAVRGLDDRGFEGDDVFRSFSSLLADLSENSIIFTLLKEQNNFS